ncbi:MAG: uracil-DNA glycosylase [Luteitalea sp.]|nr:uracil-DNA glycosylase [Luteitalea sp.]
MPIDPHLRAQLEAHLEFFTELGAEGTSRDAAWRFDAGRRARAEEAPRPRVDEAAAPTRVDVPARSTDVDVALPTTTLFDVGDAVRPPRETLEDIRGDIGDCTRCKLCGLGRSQIVFGVGSPIADLMFVGEAPGYEEDVQGIPFVGRAGQLLTKIIEAMGMRREDVYIANVIKCRPPENRNPEADEVGTCEPFLFRQIDVIQPKVIVALGTFAAQCLLKTSAPISKLRGRVFPYRGAKLVPTFHPAYLLRSPDKKRDCWEDMKGVMALLRSHGILLSGS